MIPDKIYIPIIEEDGKKLICTNWWETDTSSRNAYVNETIPYIRKDALIEKLEKAAASYKSRSDEGELVWQNMCGINEAIEILNEM